jgi:hypothetical protein
MKKTLILSILALVALTTSCTENIRAKQWGGKMSQSLPAGRKLVNATWKESNLWLLTRPMHSNEVAETYSFQEVSSWGVMEGSITISETASQ